MIYIWLIKTFFIISIIVSFLIQILNLVCNKKNFTIFISLLSLLYSIFFLFFLFSI
ncbi:hypothetical protein ONB66_00785 [Candidatus Vidania fulgoroideae]|uniref:Uncharacterized protein n=1 Tax=Candidatus Vidania fulgoroideorum TaxID=881286 RepID=A0AAX3NA99_9PROT|nr:hypothetical protein ONB67_00110 [Candidatus Vidania fulgoroideae]WDR79378.1 hypothetical protein ONB66_00785 [Candidatus Vidania fulgoroideae]